MVLTIPATPLNDADQSGLYFIGKPIFDQPFLSIFKQLSLLEQRNLIINDAWLAVYFLNAIGYYRLKAYFQLFLLNNNSNDGFKAGTTFSDILKLYIFHRELRLLIVHVIEHIGVTLRISLSNTMSNNTTVITHKNLQYFKVKL